MATPLPIVAQYCMDDYYSNYKQDSQFFELSDFIFAAGATLGDYYKNEFLAKYNEIRQEKSEEIVTFSPDILIDKVVDVKDGIAKFGESYMSFLYDRNSVGIQIIQVVKPEGDCVDLERSNLAQLWQLKLLPATNTIFWIVERGNIRFYNKGEFNVQKVRVFYVPGIGENTLVPDSLVDWVVSNTVVKKKQINQGNVVKKAINENPNMVLESEIDKTQLK